MRSTLYLTHLKIGWVNGWLTEDVLNQLSIQYDKNGDQIGLLPHLECFCIGERSVNWRAIYNMIQSGWRANGQHRLMYAALDIRGDLRLNKRSLDDLRRLRQDGLSLFITDTTNGDKDILSGALTDADFAPN